MTSTTTTERTSARERLLAAAEELFYDEGVNTVGIDRVIERAGVAKASLYKTFGSKEQLVCAYLEARHERQQAQLLAALASRWSTPAERLLGVFAVQGEAARRPGFHGCAFANATAETAAGSPVHQAAGAYRSWLRELFRNLAEQAGATDPDALSRSLVLLYDGAATSARMDADPGAAVRAGEVARVLLDSQLAADPARA